MAIGESINVPVEHILSLENVCKSFNGIKAVSNLTFAVPKGNIVSLIGPNGSGKTTVFNLITGIQHPVSGMIGFQGNSIVDKLPFQIARLGIARTFQNIRLFPQMTLLDNILLANGRIENEQLLSALIRTVRRRAANRDYVEHAEGILLNIGLIAEKNRLASDLSFGQRRFLEIARAIALKPRLLLLDEPMAGLSPENCLKLMQMLRDLRSSGTTVLFIEHNMDIVMELSDKVILMDKGGVLVEGSPQQIQSDAQVAEAYMGRSSR